MISRKEAISIGASAAMGMLFPTAAFAGNGNGVQKQLQDSSCIDWKSLTTEEIHRIVDLGRNELATRDLIAAENLVLVDVDNVQLYLTGKYEMWGGNHGSKYMKLHGVFVNNSEYKIGINIDDSYINGWDAHASGFSSIEPGKKARVTIDVCVEEADVSCFEEVQDWEVSFHTFDGDSYRTMTKLDPIVVRFDVPEIEFIEEN